MITQTIVTDLTTNKLPGIVFRSEEVGREIGFVLTEEDGETPIDLTGYTVKFVMIKPDRNFVIADMVNAVLTETEQMTTATGTGYYCVRVSDDNTLIYSGQGLVSVDDHVLSDELLESISEVNGLIFPDDFLTSADLDGYVTDEELATALSDYVTASGLADALEDYATEDYVDEAISHIETMDVYSTEEKAVGTWIDGRTIYEKTFHDIPLGTDGNYTLFASGIDIAFLVSAYYVNSGTGYAFTPNYISRYGAGGNCTQNLELFNHALNVWNSSATSILWTGTVRYVKSV